MLHLRSSAKKAPPECTAQHRGLSSFNIECCPQHFRRFICHEASGHFAATSYFLGASVYQKNLLPHRLVAVFIGGWLLAIIVAYAAVIVHDKQPADIHGQRKFALSLDAKMLTGNQDSATAVQAVNEGRVFRFLNKSCDMAEIKQAIIDAQSHHDSTNSEKDLLLDTMLGSINVLTDIAELYSDRLTSKTGISDVFTDIAESLRLQVTTEHRVAARVLLVGLASLSDDERMRLSIARIETTEHQGLLEKLCQISAKTVSRLPRFSEISELLSTVPIAESLSLADGNDLVSATALRISFYWDILRKKGRNDEEAIESIKLAMPSIRNGYWDLIMDHIFNMTA
jgi:hypothetical protein